MASFGSPLSAPPSLSIGRPDPDITYRTRHAVRTIILHPTTRTILLLRCAVDDYHKLPGGGVEEIDGDDLAAAARELLEETGCVADWDDDDGGSRTCMAETREWRDFNATVQISRCYTGTLRRDTGVTNLTAEEADDGLTHEWVPLQEALRRLRECRPRTAFGRSVRERDLFLVEEYERRRAGA